MHGIDYRSARMGAETVQFDDRDKFAYLRNVKIQRPLLEKLMNRNIFKNIGNSSDTISRIKPGIKCYNCKEECFGSKNTEDKGVLIIYKTLDASYPDVRTKSFGKQQ